MFIRNGIRTNLRSGGRTALFIGMILVLTLAMVLALGVRLYSDAALDKCDKSYRSIAVVEYMGSEYPSLDEPDPAARAAAAAIDDNALLSLPGVRAWYRECHTLSRVEGFRRLGNDMPYKDRGVIVVTHLSPVYAKVLLEPGYDPDAPYHEPEYVETDKVDYYTAIITRALYSYTGKENIFISVLPDYLPADVEYSGNYVLHGTFVDGDDLGIHNGVPAFLVQRFSSSDQYPVAGLEPGMEPEEPFWQAAEHYRTINNYIHTVVCGDLNDLWEFHQSVVYLQEGRMPESADECVISGDLAEKLSMEAGQQIDVTAFSSSVTDRYDITLTDRKTMLTVVGITNVCPEYTAYIWRQMEPPETTLFGYRIGIAELENSRAVDAVEAMEGLVPENVRISLLDQGYADAVEPFLALQSTAANVLLLCTVGTAAVLVLFALLFVGRQSDTVRILVSLGTPRRKIALWLLSGALVIAGGASLAGGVLGLVGLPAVFRRIQTQVSGEEELLRFSETLISTVKKAEINANAPVWPLVLTVAAILLLALLLCFLFLRVAYRGGTLRRGRSRVRVPKGKTSTFSSGSLRFALLSIRRGGPRALLVTGVSAALAVVIIILGSIYRGWETKLDEALNETMLEGQVTSSDGRYYSGLTIPIKSLHEVLAQDDVGDMYVSLRDVYWMPEDIPAFGEGGFAQERRDAWIAAQSQLVGVNNLKGAKEYYFTDPVIEWVDGWDASCLSDDSYPTIFGALLRIEGDGKLEPYPAIVGDSFMESHGLTPGCEFSCLMRGSALLGAEIPIPLRIVGVYHQSSTRAHIYLPLSAYIPLDVIFGEVPSGGDSYAFRYGRFTADNYKAYIYNYYTVTTCRFMLSSASHLTETRESLARAGFGWPGHLGANRTTIVLRDASFVKLTENLGRSLSMGRTILGLIFGVVALLGFIISWLLISGRKREFAVMRGLGVSRGRLFLSFFWEQALLCLLGCAIGCMALFRFYAGGPLQWLVLGGYVICYLAGCALSVKLIGRMNLMELLTVRE